MIRLNHHALSDRKREERGLLPCHFIYRLKPLLPATLPLVTASVALPLNASTTVPLLTSTVPSAAMVGGESSPARESFQSCWPSLACRAITKPWYSEFGAGEEETLFGSVLSLRKITPFLMIGGFSVVICICQLQL